MTLDDYLAAMDPELRAAYLPLRPIFEGWPVDLIAARHMQAAMTPKTPAAEGIERTDIEIGTAQTERLKLRLYRTQGSDASSRPVVLWMHGGGWYAGGLDQDDAKCDQLAADLQAVVVSVEYRLAPEHPFPAALEDSYTALTWVVDHAGELGIDPSRVAVAGASAGGNLAAALSLLARDRQGPKISHQLLMYPVVTGAGLDQLTGVLAADGFILDRRSAQACLDAYAGDDAAAVSSPYFAPLSAEDLSNLPPAYIMVGGLDILRDSTVAYAAKLMTQGVATELHVYPGAFHGFDALAPTASVTRRAERDYFDALGRALS